MFDGSILSEKVYTCTRCVDGDTVVFEVLDTAAQVSTLLTIYMKVLGIMIQSKDFLSKYYSKK